MPLKAFDPHRTHFVCQRDYKKAAGLWTQAADRKHWKAMLNLANAYAEGEGVDRNTERAVQIVESAMKLGIPSAFDLMGSFQMNGVGVKQDTSRADGLAAAGTQS